MLYYLEKTVNQIDTSIAICEKQNYVAFWEYLSNVNEGY